MKYYQQFEHLRCPFCLNHNLEANPGKKTCPECSAEFEVDDRGECIFVSPENLKLPVNGLVCVSCGLLQGDKAKKCLYCGATSQNK